MTGLERIILNVCHRCTPNLVEVEENHLDVEGETLYLLRLAALDAEEKRFRNLQRDGRRRRPKFFTDWRSRQRTGRSC